MSCRRIKYTARALQKVISYLAKKNIELLERTLLSEKIDFIKNNARGEESLARYGLQICSLRLTGRFMKYL